MTHCHLCKSSMLGVAGHWDGHNVFCRACYAAPPTREVELLQEEIRNLRVVTNKYADNPGVARYLNMANQARDKRTGRKA